MLLSFDSAVPRILLEVTGSEGTLLLPDPNMFDGDIRLRAMGAEEWETVENTTVASSPAAPACWTWRGPSARTGRTGPRAPWPTTCSTSWWPSPNRVSGASSYGGEHRRAGAAAAGGLGSEGRHRLTLRQAQAHGVWLG